MTWVLPEILIPLLLALGLGVLIGWLLWRWRRRSIHASEWNQLARNSSQAQADVAATRAAYEEANNERSILAKQVASLTEDLEAARAGELAAADQSDSLSADLEISRHEFMQATTRAASLETELVAATGSSAESELLEKETARLRDELEQAVEGGNRELEAALAAARTELDISQSRIADFDARLSITTADLAAAHARVGELEALISDGVAAETEHIGQQTGALAAASTADEDVGISVAEHVDDLKVIRGIGPRMEELLTTLGITSWEQLAELDAAGVSRVDDALSEFPGRIERDQWVDQARELLSQFPDVDKRPTRDTFRNRSNDEDPFN